MIVIATMDHCPTIKLAGRVIPFLHLQTQDDLKKLNVLSLQLDPIFRRRALKQRCPRMFWGNKG